VSAVLTAEEEIHRDAIGEVERESDRRSANGDSSIKS
jgi:hypothetical protein